MTYLILLGVLIPIILGLRFAFRSYAQITREQEALTEDLRRTVAQHGWTYESNPPRNLALRITGTSDGIPWTIQQDDGANSDFTPAITWSTGLTDQDPLMLYVADVQSASAMRGMMGEWVLKLAEKADKQGVLSRTMRSFFTNAEEYAFVSPHLGMRYGALTTSKPFARQMLRSPVEKILLDWPEPYATLQIGDVNVRIHWSTSNFESDGLLRLTDLGVLLTKRLRQVVSDGTQQT